MRLIIVGPPGAGKGTQAALIKDLLHIPHISTGNMFRSAIQNKTPLGIKAKHAMDRGELVSDDLTVSLVKERLEEKDAESGFLLDGFPRNVYQAEALNEILKEKNLKLDAVIDIEAKDDEIIKRIAGRRVCPQCKRGYHVTSLPPKHAGICDDCGVKLIQRDDDKEEIIKKRLEVYQTRTKPLLEYYLSSGLLKAVDGNRDVASTFADIKNFLGDFDGHH